MRLEEILVCPWCLGKLAHAPDRLTCTRCRAVYRVEGGIPHMVVAEAELYCPLCSVLLDKRGQDAVCAACGRHFRMDIRVEGTLQEHARRCCPRCDPEDVGLSSGTSEYTCPRCGARYPVENGIV